MARNDGPTVHGGKPNPSKVKNAGNTGVKDAPYEHQDYPLMLFQTGGRERVVNDPDEHAQALEDGWLDDVEEARAADEGAGSADKSTAMSRQANRKQMGSKRPGQGVSPDTATLQARVAELEEENALLQQQIEELLSTTEEGEGAEGSEVSEGANEAATNKAQNEARGGGSKAGAKTTPGIRVPGKK